MFFSYNFSLGILSKDLLEPERTLEHNLVDQSFVERLVSECVSDP